jgi:hypothetical protein
VNLSSVTDLRLYIHLTQSVYFFTLFAYLLYCTTILYTQKQFVKKCYDRMCH